jgi:hypothetical protein
VASDTARAAGVMIAVLALVATLAVGGYLYLRDRGGAEPVPGQERCVGTANDAAVAVDLDQAHYASIIVGLSVRRGLSPRAASIAMATVYQETGIRNLDYGDRDSVGLFQQRPSQGWGSARELRDPYYATNAFYDALVKIDGWESGDINDVAQRVQVSGYPDAYRDHEADARILASTLTGSSPAGFVCLDRSNTPGNAEGLAGSLRKTFGKVLPETVDATVVVDARTTRLAWAYAHYAVANAKYYGVTAVTVGDRTWQTGEFDLPEWTTATPTPGAAAAAATRVTITVR